MGTEIDRPLRKGERLALARDRSPRGSSISISTSFEMTCGVFFVIIFLGNLLIYGIFKQKLGLFILRLKSDHPENPLMIS